MGKKAKKKARKLKEKAKRTAQRGAEKMAAKLDDTDDQTGDFVPNAPRVKPPKVRSGIHKDVIVAMHHEMNAMSAGAGWHATPLNAHMLDGQKFIMLEGQSGKVAEALTYDDVDNTRVYDELIRCAVIAAAWAQSLGPNKGKGRKSQWAAVS